jgi:hypothetical protein
MGGTCAVPSLSRACGGGLGWSSLGDGTRGESPHPPSLRYGTLPRKCGRGKKSYVAAVVTPPSTTIVWPVMKVEASDAR